MMLGRMTRHLVSLCYLSALAVPALADQTVPEGRDVYLRYCAECHGPDAHGGAREGGSPAPDLTKIAERRGSVWPMLEVMSIIDGYTKSTEPRADMPVIAELSDGELIMFDTGNGLEVTAPANLMAVVHYLESIQLPQPSSYVP